VRMTFSGFRLARQQAFARVPILPRHVFSADAAALLTSPANRSPVGTGPLRFVSWRPGISIELERFEGYWGEPAGARRIVYRVTPNRQQATNALIAGKLDLAVQMPVDAALDLAVRDQRIDVYSYTRPAYLAVVYNLRRPAHADVRTRRALTMLLDRGAIADKVFRGYAQVISGPFLLGGREQDPAVVPLPFDPKTAGRLLSRALGDGTLRFSLLTPAGSRASARIADIWAEDARPHAQIAVEPLAYAEVLARVREGRFDAALMAFTTARDLDLFTRFHSSEVSGENYGALKDAEVDRTLEAIRRQPDRAKRNREQRALHRLLHQLQPYTFIVSDARLGLVRKGIGGLGAGSGLSARFLWRKQ